jgi:hypothetical protein
MQASGVDYLKLPVLRSPLHILRAGKVFSQVYWMTLTKMILLALWQNLHLWIHIYQVNYEAHKPKEMDF